MGTFYARSENEAGQKETAQHHLDRAGALCSEYLEPIGYADLGALLGRLHDFGKLSDRFQQVLEGKKIHVNHAIPGAVIARSMGLKLLPEVIASHHGELRSFVSYDGTIKKAKEGTGDGLDRENYELSVFGPGEYRDALTLWRSWFAPKKPKDLPGFSDREDAMLSRMLFARFLFSALVDADWSSAAEHSDPKYLQKHSGPKLDAAAALDKLLQIREEKRRSSTAASSLNQLRNGLFDRCLEAGQQEPGLFTLTAPTGLGKTLSLMAFALRHAVEHQKRRVILILPYLSILEQNCRDYEKIIPELLQIHSNVKWTEEARHLAQRWDAPCIVTTNVSFFEPLFSAKGGTCRHLHQLANSIIVLDEAQTLPAELLDATLRTVKELCDRYGCTVVFSTATQPSFQHRPGLDWKPRQIAEDPAAMFEATRRVRWQWQVETETPLEQVCEELADYPQCCVIVNLKRHARKLLQLLREECGEESVFYLTTDLCPAHRTAVLDEVRLRLKEGLPCHLVATQCIEAGVDLDFPVVYRALAPLDSLIQAAGRCNRNGDSPKGLVKVFVPDEDGRRYPTAEYQRAALCVRTLLSRHPIDCSNLAHIEEYYKLLYENGDGDKRELRDAIADEDYPEVEKQYQMIGMSGVQVIVPYGGKMKLYEAIRDRLDREGLSAGLLREAKEVMVASFDLKNVKQNCQSLYFRSREHGQEAPTEFYLLGNPVFYDEKQGLRFDAPFDGIL